MFWGVAHVSPRNVNVLLHEACIWDLIAGLPCSFWVCTSKAKKVSMLPYLHITIHPESTFSKWLYPECMFPDQYKDRSCLTAKSWGIPPPSRGKVGKNRSTLSKTTVRSKRVGPLGSRAGPLIFSHSVKLLLFFSERVWHIKCFVLYSSKFGRRLTKQQ